MYQIKQNSAGPERWISKLLLNSLYGLFGRNKSTLQSITIDKSLLQKYIVAYVVKSIIKVSDSKFTLLVVGNINYDIVRELNFRFVTDIKSYDRQVKSNVAIASAVTSYARVYMLKYKLSDSVYYTDTDSIFTSEKLDSSLIGPELGMVKDEITVNDGSIPLMNGPIKEAYFLGIKQYGYWYLNSEGRRIEKSVWAMRHE